MKLIKKYFNNLCEIAHEDFLLDTNDVLFSDKFISTSIYLHHASYSCYEHSLHVSYISYILSKKLNLDSIATARGALLHDFYLYDWHIKDPDRGIHGFNHPKIAHKNASDLYSLNSIETDIILKHMFPLTIQPPVYKESVLVCFVDKLCTVLELLKVEFFLARAKSEVDIPKKCLL